MASYGQTVPMARPGYPQQPPAAAAAVAAAAGGGQHHHHEHHGHAPHGTAPAGTFTPGTKIQVGSHRVVIQKYLSEGGFAHVYLVKMATAIGGTDLAVLKRVAVPDKDSLRSMRTEVETMKRLKGHRAIVTYFDSHASELRGGGYEVFLLMEYCDGGGLMDFMNTRLQHRLTEPEILGIFSDVAEGVACMHYLKPPLLHRDLKVENVLISKGSSGSGGSSSRRRFKLCDFGSAAVPKPAPVSVVECRLMDEDVQRHTTLQYRSPEMIDVYRRQPIDEKSDIWALGVLLYKLCYYTTPFEDQSSQLAILNASYRFPSHPIFSDRLKSLIASMLRENQDSRPNIYQVLREACVMQGKEVPIKDIYSSRSRSEPRDGERAPPPDRPSSTPVVGAVFAPDEKEEQVIPDIVPMRRGRPTATPTVQAPAKKPTPSPLRVTSGDPFAALDAKAATKGQSADDLSFKFPTLDQFSILHDQGARFSFGDGPAGTTPQAAAAAATAALAAGKNLPGSSISNKPPAEPLQSAGRPSRAPNASPERHVGAPTSPRKISEMSRASAIISSTPELKAISANQRENAAPALAPRPQMVSTGTMTSPSPTPPPTSLEAPSRAKYQIYHFPSSDRPHPNRASSLPKKKPQDAGAISRDHASSTSPPPWAQPPQLQSGHIRHPSSSRPSLEGSRPALDALETVTTTVPSLPIRARPASSYLESDMDYLREREGANIIHPAALSPGYSGAAFSSSDVRALSRSPGLDAGFGSSSRDEAAFGSNVDYLRSMEESDGKRDRGLGKPSVKRSSMTALAGTKNILAGKFSDAFKLFEMSTSGVPPPARTPSPLKEIERPRDVSSRGQSRGFDSDSGGHREDAYANEEALEVTDDMPPEVRREIERRRLSMEEKRVAAAAAEYRQRIARRDTGPEAGSSPSASSMSGPAPVAKTVKPVSRAMMIQHRVQSLLSESQSTNVARTASGYGHFTDDGSGSAKQGPSAPAKPASLSSERPEVQRKLAAGKPSVETLTDVYRSAPAKPAAPPKPLHLNKPLPQINKAGNNTTGSSESFGRPSSPTMKPPSRATLNRASSKSQLMAADLPGQPVLEGMTLQDRDDYIRDFTRRFPSLNAIEMVERDLSAEDDGRR